jgi:hypothetical protein
LIFLGWNDAEKAKSLFAESPVFDWEELHYDWDGMELNKALVLVEKTAGACFAAYSDWINYVNHRIHK